MLNKTWIKDLSLNGLKSVLTVLAIFCLSNSYAQTPVASFTTVDSVGCAPFSMTFNNTSTNANVFFWDFGNGNTSSLPNPNTIYINSGTYTVTLVAGNSTSGQSDTLIATNYFNIVPDPTSSFTVNQTTACLNGNTFNFTNTSVNATAYTWDFGDGNSSNLANPTHSYTAPGNYTIKLIAKNTFGCENISIQNNYITVYPNPNAFHSASFTSSCDSTDVFSFTSHDPNITSWFWEFGDGNTSNIQNPVHIYNTSGAFNVSLTVTDINGCTKKRLKSNYINIGTTLVPSFTVNDTGGCAPFTANFTSTVPNAISWNWDFGDGSTSTTENPNHTYSIPGNYDITLTVNTTAGCNGSVTVPSFITIDPFPSASFTTVEDTGCIPFDVQFINTSTGSTSWLWDFGDGNTSTVENPTHTYSVDGNYDVTLISYSANGCSDTILINNAIDANLLYVNFTATPKHGCPGLNVPFVPNHNLFASYLWDFGDGSTSILPSPNHVYNFVGTYTVSLTVVNSSGCTKTKVKTNYVRVIDTTFIHTTPDTIIGCTPTEAVFADPTPYSNAWLWDFGNGDTSHQQNPTYSFDSAGIYNVSLVTGLAGGCQTTINQYAVYDIRQVNEDTIKITAINHCNPYSISLEYDTTNVISMTWYFGDGDSSNVWNPTHIYAAPGDYQIILKLRMDAGCTANKYLTVTLGHSTPVSFTTLDPCIGDTIQFNASSPTFTSYFWLFGDGDSSTLADPKHAYQTIGNYVASITVTDISGCTHTYISEDTIKTTDVYADFSVSGSTSGCNVLAATFINNSIGGSTYFWDFGDGNTSTLPSPSHTYVVPGIYDVSLTVTDSGCVHTKTKTNYISVTNFLANFTYAQNDNCFPITVNYTDQSLNAVSWLWEFGDSTTSTLQNPVHIFTEPPTGPVKLTITDINGCQITRSKTNIDYDLVNFEVSDSVGCVPFTTTFTDLSTNAMAWRWDFGDGNTSTAQNPTHTYMNNSAYDVQLIVDFASGCTDTILFPNRFTLTAPTSDFSSPTTAACSPATIDFVNQSTNATSYTWDFGDSTTSNISDPSHIYNIPGYYTVSLIASNDDGCSDTTTYNNFLLIPGTYTNFNVNSTDGCPMLVNQFSDLSINASTWNWNFGDGYSSTVQNPQHLYADTGTFQVTLITTDTIGCSSVFTMPMPITIHPLPVASASVTNPNICAPSNVTFLNTSTNATSFVWSFGNGDTSHAQIPTYSFNNAGTFDVELIAISSFGCTDTQVVAPSIIVSSSPVANFIVDSISGCAPNNVNFYSLSTDTMGATYNWTFGNGSTYSGIDPSVYYANPGNYSVLLTVNNSNGCADTSLQTINIPAKPVANASISDTVGCAPFFCQFSEQAMGAVNYFWNFGDGNTSTSANPSHVYVNSGTYTPMLVVQNTEGCVDTFYFSYSINVYDNPQAIFSAGNGTGCNPHTEQFVNNSTFNPGAVFSWEFGDGKTSSLMNPNNVYDTAGTFNVSLTVTDLTGCWDSTSKNLNVYKSPVAYAIVDNDLGCEPFSVNFTNTSQFGSSFVWSFGDNNLSVTQNPSHTYTNMGSYTPILVAISPLGCADTFTFSNPINVNTSPVASFSANDTIGCVGANIVFTNSSTNLSGASYLWTLENGITSNAFNPNITLTTPGVHDITLIVTNNGGCGDTIFEPLYLHVRDTIAPPSDQMYSVSVLNNNSIELIWDQSTNPNADLYRLYRYDTQSQTYVNIYTDPVHLPNSDTVRRYVDNGLATLYNTYSYKIQTVDVCDNKIPIDEINPSTSINLETVTVDADVYLSWTPYEGCNLSGYQIERTNSRTGFTEYIEIASPLVLNYVDTFLICPDIYSYKVRALDLCNTLYTAVSDTDNARPYLDPGNQVVEIVRSTVVDDLYTLTEWTEPNRDPHRVVSYEIYRSTDNVNFYHLESVPHYDLSYLDYNVDVDNQVYYYQIVVSNDCAIPNIESNKSSSILLKADWRNDKTLIEWTPYVKWKDGIGNYVIEKLDDSGNWIMIKVVDKNTDSIEIDD